ncbi:hypothetical protein [Reyranella sp.]|uniref:hypothetical protein n=1 Tax=Reyranella sp. TaxID=1929291 RepID=UPI003D151296
MKKLLVVAALSMLTGCAGQQSPWVQAYGTNFPQANPGEAAVYLVRGPAPADAPPINITMGQQALGGLPGQSWMRLNLVPKLYDIRAYGTQANAELIITVDPGQTRFFEAVTVEPGSARLMEIGPGDGRRLVNQGQQAPILQ